MEAKVGLALKNSINSSSSSSSGVAKVRELLGTLEVPTCDEDKNSEGSEAGQQQRQPQRPFVLSRHLRTDLLTSILLEMPINLPRRNRPTTASTVPSIDTSIETAEVDMSEALTWALSSALTRPDAGGCQRALAACTAATPPRWQAALLLLNAMQAPLSKYPAETDKSDVDMESTSRTSAEERTPPPMVPLTLDCVATAMTACLRGSEPAEALQLFHFASANHLINHSTAAAASRRSRLVFLQCAFRACSALKDGATAQKVWQSVVATAAAPSTSRLSPSTAAKVTSDCSSAGNRDALRPDARLAAAAIDALAYAPWPPPMAHQRLNRNDVDSDNDDSNDETSSGALKEYEQSPPHSAVEWPLSAAHTALLSADAAGAFTGEEVHSRGSSRRPTTERAYSRASTWPAPLCAAVLRSYRPPPLQSPLSVDEDALLAGIDSSSADVPSTSHVAEARARAERVLTFLEDCISRGIRFDDEAGASNSRRSSSESSAYSGRLRTSLWKSASADVLAACAPAAAIDGQEVLNKALSALARLAPKLHPRSTRSSSHDSSDKSKPMPEAAIVGLALRKLRVANRANDALPLVNLLRDRFIIPASRLSAGEAPGVGASDGSNTRATEEAEKKGVQELAAWVHMEAVQCYLDSGRPQYAVAWLSSLPRKSAPQTATNAADTIDPPATAAPNMRTQDLPAGVSFRASPDPSSQGSAALGATAEVYANVMRACLKRVRLLEEALPLNRTSAWTGDSSTKSSRPSSNVDVRKALAADEVPEPVMDFDDDNDEGGDDDFSRVDLRAGASEGIEGFIREKQSSEADESDKNDANEGGDDGYGVDDLAEFDVEAAWALAERKGGALDEAARQLEAAAAAVAEASELREAVLVLYEEMKLRGVSACS